MLATLVRQRREFLADGPPSAAERRHRIDRLLSLVLDNADEFVDAMAADYGTRPRAGSLFTEILGMISVIEHTRSHVAQWMRSTPLPRPGRLFGLKAAVDPSPLGSRGNHRPVELPLKPCCTAGCGGLRRGQPRDDQDVRDHAAHRRLDEVRRRRPAK